MSKTTLSNDNRLFGENPDYLSKQLITYLGNKRTLLSHISQAIDVVKARLNKDKLVCFDCFSGSGVVSRLLKSSSEYLIVNDIEDYAQVISDCYLANKSEVDIELVEYFVNSINDRVLLSEFPMGFIEELYAPIDELNITKNDRVFYTQLNARKIDNYRRLIGEIPVRFQKFLLAPLLSQASIRTNTAGIFKAFYKHGGKGKYGGRNVDALKRILGEIIIPMPILSSFDCAYEVYKDDTNKIVSDMKNLDLTYIDPPYNQHPYGSNYFMLNLIVNYQRPNEISKVSGIPKDWNRSEYNVKAKSIGLMTELIDKLDSKYILISFNNEGFISLGEMTELLNRAGEISVFEKNHNAFRASRNFNRRSIHTKEYLFMVKK